VDVNVNGIRRHEASNVRMLANDRAASVDDIDNEMGGSGPESQIEMFVNKNNIDWE